MGGRVFAAAVTGALALGASTTSTTTPARDLIATHDTKVGATYISPWLDVWPRPDFLIYPIVAATDAGARTIILRMVIRDAPWGLRKSLRLTIDGETVSLPLDRPNAVTEDNGGCRNVTRVSLGGQERTLRKIVGARDVRVIYSEAGQSYRLDQVDLTRARRLLEIFDGADLPSGNGALEEFDTSPKLIKSAKVSPRFPAPANARIDKADVKVTLRAMIDVDGSLKDVRILEPAGGDCGFEEAAMEAVRQWRYEPGTRQGKPVPVDFTIVVAFSKF